MKNASKAVTSIQAKALCVVAKAENAEEGERRPQAHREGRQQSGLRAFRRAGSEGALGRNGGHRRWRSRESVLPPGCGR